jgi:hypothetical protein
MRHIHDHKVSGLNEALDVIVQDEPGPGGANHLYAIFLKPPSRPEQVCAVLEFQNGPIATPQDMNGITNEALLAVLIDRMRGFQFAHGDDCRFDVNKRGAFACRENACALTHLEEAMMWLQKRTRERMQRGVEGKLKP